MFSVNRGLGIVVTLHGGHLLTVETLKQRGVYGIETVADTAIDTVELVQDALGIKTGLEISRGCCSSSTISAITIATPSEQGEENDQNPPTISVAPSAIAVTIRNGSDIGQARCTNGLSSQLANCCCENRQGQADIKYAMATDTCAITNSISNAARDITDNANANYRQLHDELVAMRMEDKDAQIADLTRQLGQKDLAASQCAQNAYLISQLHPSPIPAFNVPNPKCYGGLWLLLQPGLVN